MHENQESKEKSPLFLVKSGSSIIRGNDPEFFILQANLDVESEAKRLGIDVGKSKRYESTKEGTKAMYDQAFCMCESILKDE